jgi:hypothetical protein
VDNRPLRRRKGEELLGSIRISKQLANFFKSLRFGVGWKKLIIILVCCQKRNPGRSYPAPEGFTGAASESSKFLPDFSEKYANLLIELQIRLMGVGSKI